MIKYVKGDATNPQGKGTKIIVHVCNDVGAWGAGFVLALSRKWTGPEKEYRRIRPEKRKLGYVQYVSVTTDIIVVNMIAQHNIKRNVLNVPPIRYIAVQTCLNKTVEYCKSIMSGGKEVSIHMPRIGCGLAGGSWSVMEAVIKEAIPDEIPVIVYDFE